MSRRILILGGGTGGIVAANVLRKTLDRMHQVLLVDRKIAMFTTVLFPCW